MLINNKNIKTGLLFGFCLLVMCSGCRKLIQIDPPTNSINNTGEFISDAQAKTAMAGLYSQMISSDLSYSNGGNTITAGLSSDEIVATAGPSVTDFYQLQQNRIKIDNHSTGGFWDKGYQHIYAANSILENLPGAVNISDTLRKELTGEAKFVRAFAYFYLTNNFGDVPLVLTTDFNKTAKLPRSAQAVIYKQIVNDLIDAQSALPSDYHVSSNHRTVPNKLAATALLSRVYLYEQDWKNAEAQATLLINNALLNLNNKLDQVFMKNSLETIWQLEINNHSVSFGGTPEPTGFIPSIIFSELSLEDQEAFLADYETYKLYFVANYSLRPDLANAFENDDQRKLTWVGYAKSPDAEPYNGVITYYPYKYKQIQSNSTTVPLNEYCVVFRLAEQYLIRAEARTEQENIAGAAEDLNRIRSRARLPNTTASTKTALLAAIMHERRVELFTEWGHRWFDLKRTGQAFKVLSGIPDKIPFSINALLYPIPVRDINNDPFLNQNPGY